MFTIDLQVKNTCSHYITTTRLLSLVTTLMLLFSCNSNQLDVNIDNIKVQTELIQVDAFLRTNDSLALRNNHDKLVEELGFLYSYELEMNLQSPLDSNVYTKTNQFYSSEYIQELEKEKELLFTTFEEKHAQVNTAFRYLNYHFPSAQYPKKLVLMNKLFSGIKANDSVLTIAGENYLDPLLPVIKNLPGDQLYQWQKDAMKIEFLPRDVLQFWIQAKLFKDMDENLVNHIIQAGKVMYVLHASFPKESVAYALRYSNDEYSWAEENELAFWEYLVKEELLFKNNLRDKANILNEGPYTVGLPEEGPDRLGQYLGFKMVSNYMASNKDLSLQELIALDYNTILQAYEID